MVFTFCVVKTKRSVKTQTNIDAIALCEASTFASRGEYKGGFCVFCAVGTRRSVKIETRPVASINYTKQGIQQIVLPNVTTPRK